MRHCETPWTNYNYRDSRPGRGTGQPTHPRPKDADDTGAREFNLNRPREEDGSFDDDKQGLTDVTTAAMTMQDTVETRAESEYVRACTCRIEINGRSAFVLIDTGSMVTLVNSRILDLNLATTIERPMSIVLRSASGHTIPILCEALILFTFGQETREHPAFVCHNIPQDAIIGFDFIRQHNVRIDAPGQSIQLARSGKIPLQQSKKTSDTNQLGPYMVYVGPQQREPTSAPPGEGQLTAVISTETEENGVRRSRGRSTGERCPLDVNTDETGCPASKERVSSPGMDERADVGPMNKVEPIIIKSLSELTEKEDTPNDSLQDKNAICIGPTSPEEREILSQLIDEFPECFGYDGALGSCDLIQHRIELTTKTPVRRPAYKVAHAEKAIIEKEVREMLDKGVIEPSVSPYAAGVVLVPKKSGEVRFCVDYRGLNEVTKADHYPVPLARTEIFDAMGEAQIFSCLDCQQGYWQVGVAEEDRHKTAFRCFLGLFEFVRMPYGMRNAGATYQRLMSHILSGYIGKFCHCFVDDVICFSRTFEEHVGHLRLIFERLRAAGIKLKPSKCVLAKEQVQYLGHLISPGEIRPDPGNISKIRDLAAPETVRQVRTFLGMASYYRSFVQDFSKRALPLTTLTKKNVTFNWGVDEDKAFQDLKKILTEEPVLTLPDFSKPFVLMTDGSSSGLGAILGQQFEGEKKERVIGYASRRTTKLEENYSACEIECMALVWATKHFREYILGRTTRVLTDHWALKWLLDLRNPNPRLQRWRMALQEYDLVIFHKPGKQHQNADFLSRMYEDPKPSKRQMEDPKGDREQGQVVTAAIAESMESAKVTFPLRRRGLAELQMKDDDCRQLKQAVEGGGALPHWAKGFQFRISSDGVLERVSNKPPREEAQQIVLPECLIKAAVQDAHGGHLKVGKTLGNLKRSFFFRNMYTVCEKYIAGCPRCQQKDRGRKIQAPLGDMPPPLGAWHTVAVDVMGPLPQTRSGKKYVVVMTDYLTRFVLAIATKDQTAETTAEAMMEKFLEYGLPERLITDNGPNFRSRLLAEMCKLLRTAQLFTTPYHPQFDGLCERFNRTLASMLRGFVATHQRDWDKYIPYIMHAYRAAPQESTGESPFFLMFGRPCRAPLSLGLRPARPDFPDVIQEVDHTKGPIVARMHTAFKTVQAALKEAHNRQKKYHDKRSKERHFKIGDEVLLLDERVHEGQTKKLCSPWKPGYRVVETVGPLNYRVEHPNRRGKILRVHVNRLKAQQPEYVWPADLFLDSSKRSLPAPPPALGQHLDRWLSRERAKYQPFEPVQCPLPDISSEEEEEAEPTAEAGEPEAGPPPRGTAVRPENARPITRRPRRVPRTKRTRSCPLETPIFRRSERIQRLQRQNQ